MHIGLCRVHEALDKEAASGSGYREPRRVGQVLPGRRPEQALPGAGGGFGGFNLKDYFPGLARSLGFLSRRFLRNRAHETHKRWDELLETILSDHERRDSMMHHHDGGDFIDVSLLSVQKEYGMTRDHVKAILVVSTVVYPTDRIDPLIYIRPELHI